jgi:hypothetical protein
MESRAKLFGHPALTLLYSPDCLEVELFYGVRKGAGR